MIKFLKVDPRKNGSYVNGNYTDFKLKDEWISTPVDQATLEKYWAET